MATVTGGFASTNGYKKTRRTAKTIVPVLHFQRTLEYPEKHKATGGGSTRPTSGQLFPRTR